MEKIDEKFYGRLKTRELTERQQNLLANLLPLVSVKSVSDIDLTGYSGGFLEIGFGGGEHLSQIALANPDKLFIGAEPFVNGVASLLTHIDENNIKNIRIFQEDARKLISEIQDGFLDGAFLLFPDPWPKRKHFKRRFVQERMIHEIYRILKQGSSWKIATDHETYGKWILKIFEKEPFFNMFSRELFDRNSRPSEEAWPKTRYESKATSENIIYAVYTKV